MSKRNIRARSGKQLYLNNSFTKGMLYTSSEIPEGYTKIINNFEVLGTIDAEYQSVKVSVNRLNKIRTKQKI